MISYYSKQSKTKYVIFTCDQIMKKKRFLSTVLTVTLIIGYIFSVKTFATESLAYKKIVEQDPVYTSSISINSIGDFYANRTTDEILDPKENNYIYDVVSVGGEPVMCHVYMRTFNISDVSSYTKKDAETMVSGFLTQVKDAIKDKYLKCIVRNYSITVLVKSNKEKDSYSQMTVKLMLALGESNEQRRTVIDTFIKPNVRMWEELSTTDKFNALNTFILNGQFTYDTELKNRSSIYEFVSDKKGVCEEYAGLTALFLEQMGFKNTIITGKVGDVGHMWNTVTINDRVYHLDILWNGPIDQNGVHTSVNDTYLLKSTATFSATHTPDASFTELTDKAIYDYYLGPLPTQIVSELYDTSEQGFLRVPILTPVSFFKSNIEMSEFVTVKKGEAVLDDNDYIGTDCTVIMSINGELICSVSVAVNGDCNGDGITDMTDIETVEEYILGIRMPTRDINVVQYTCDINNDGIISILDLFAFTNIMQSMPKDPSDTDTGTTAPDGTDTSGEVTSPEDTTPDITEVTE